MSVRHTLPTAVEKAFDLLVRQVRYQTNAAEFGQKFAITASKLETRRAFWALRKAIHEAVAAREPG